MVVTTKIIQMHIKHAKTDLAKKSNKQESKFQSIEIDNSKGLFGYLGFFNLG